jgi:hypothetical protein
MSTSGLGGISWLLRMAGRESGWRSCDFGCLLSMCMGGEHLVFFRVWGYKSGSHRYRLRVRGRICRFREWGLRWRFEFVPWLHWREKTVADFEDTQKVNCPATNILDII